MLWTILSSLSSIKVFSCFSIKIVILQAVAGNGHYQSACQVGNGHFRLISGLRRNEPISGLRRSIKSLLVQGPHSQLCVRKFLAYLRQLGNLVSLRTQGIVCTLILVFLRLAYAKTVFSTFCVGKIVFWGLACVGRKRTLCEIQQREVR